MTRGGAVRFAVSSEVAYDYLIDPLNRPQWQSSLRAVAFPGSAPRHGEPPLAVGLVWDDITWVGLRPTMELTVAERPIRWDEAGRWRRVEADLALHFTPLNSTPLNSTALGSTALANGCEVRAEFEIRLPGALSPLSPALTSVAVRPVLADLRRAARILARR